MAILIVGLGNLGDSYTHTRHNVGFFFADEFAKEQNLQWSMKNNLDAFIAKLGNFIVAKPQALMNNSGQVVKKLVKDFSIQKENLWVVHDDLDLKLGTYKIQFSKGPREHKGVLSIENVLKDKNFWRIRIGVDNRDPENKIPGDEYVLQSFNKDELLIVKGTIKESLVEFRSKINNGQ